jgi:hypothetical protein
MTRRLTATDSTGVVTTGDVRMGVVQFLEDQSGIKARARLSSSAREREGLRQAVQLLPK